MSFSPGLVLNLTGFQKSGLIHKIIYLVKSALFCYHFNFIKWTYPNFAQLLCYDHIY